jgi:hypothetical protein
MCSYVQVEAYEHNSAGVWTKCLLEVSLLLLLTAKKSSFPRGVIKLLAVLPRLTGTIELQTTARTPTAASHSEANIKWIANLS